MAGTTGVPKSTVHRGWQSVQYRNLMRQKHFRDLAPIRASS